MTHTLRLHDRLASPQNHEAYLEVLDPHPRGGCIKVFDAQMREDRYIQVERLVAEIHAGTLTVLRKGKPRVSRTAQPEDATLHARNALIGSLIRRIRDDCKRLGISFLQAYRDAAETYRQTANPQSPRFPSQAAIYRHP